MTFGGHSRGFDGETREQVEDKLTPQEAADQLMVVEARLNKPGENPEYALGEPVIVHLEIKNMALGRIFSISTCPTPGYVPGLHTQSPYLVTAMRYKKPVALTGMGRRSLQGIERDLELEPLQGNLSNVLYPFEPDPAHPRVTKNAHTEQAVPVRLMANLLCDMTDVGDYELHAEFAVRVPVSYSNHVMTSRAVKVVTKTPLRFHIRGYIYGVDPRPKPSERNPPPPPKIREDYSNYPGVSPRQ